MTVYLIHSAFLIENEKKEVLSLRLLHFAILSPFYLPLSFPSWQNTQKSAHGLVCVDPARLAVYILSPNDQDDTIGRNTAVGIGVDSFTWH